jgi:hypothetical protein
LRREGRSSAGPYEGVGECQVVGGVAVVGEGSGGGVVVVAGVGGVAG